MISWIILIIFAVIVFNICFILRRRTILGVWPSKKTIIWWNILFLLVLFICVYLSD
jgi:hypothetical protein